jgi:hypothetical protein
MDSTVPSKGVNVPGACTMTNMKLVSTLTQLIIYDSAMDDHNCPPNNPPNN